MSVRLGQTLTYFPKPENADDRRHFPEVTTPVKLVKATKERAITLTRAIWTMGHR